MNTPTRHLVAVAATATLLSTPLLAAEPDLTPRHIGAGGGAVAGALVGGPVGAILGTAFGALVGQDRIQQRQLADARQRQQELAEQYAATRRQLEETSQLLAERRAELVASEQQLADLHEQQRALKELVGGLELAVYFDQNSSRVDPRYQALLQSLSQGAAKVRGLQIDLEGHANSSGAADYNRELAQQRSDRVGASLEQHGALPFQLIKRSRGAEAVTSNNPYAAEDRRVDLQLHFEPEAQGEALYGVR